ncbi:MAG TPA: glycogen/starch/alpha-glucan phosphorylase [Acetobacteraceae bacterium]|nr:glycogen/starch/alpha-glucan phosphorylase [Acetobacteraceae bacterium]
MDIQDSASALTDPPGARPPLGTEEMRARILAKLRYQVGKAPGHASQRDWFLAAALAARDSVVECWFESGRRSYESGAKRVYYLSLEFLIGRLLLDAIGNLGLIGAVREALAQEGVDLEALREQEPDAALGNGGLGRLAACFLESMATLEVNAFGYGIRYEHGLFRQMIAGGVQQELPEDWLEYGNPWEFERPEVAFEIGFGGTVAAAPDPAGDTRYVWQPHERILAVAYDTPVVGGGGAHANTLRLWSARALTPLHLEAFNRGDHEGALRDRVRTEAVSRVLYPGDDSDAGQELRLRQEFFFASASLQDLLKRHLEQFGTVHNLPDKAAIQLNDTHPAIGVIELMRLLMDVHKIEWDEAWRITQATISYTNHTLLPEALETWPVPLMERLLPRHMQIIYLLNARHLEHVRAQPGADNNLLAATSLIEERHGRRVRMGHLAFLGSHAINGVSVLHTRLIRKSIFQDMDGIYPGRIQNKTNGITFRRWLHRANPGLTALLVEALGERVLTDNAALRDLAGQAENPAFQRAFAAQRLARKTALARVIRDQVGLRVDPAALFDVQVKRMHEYKRQLLNILHAVSLYDAIRAQPMKHWVPRVKIFAGKAAPGYLVAKQVIRLIHNVAQVVNSDPSVAGRLKIVFLPNYNVSLAEHIIPAADLSEQISTAGMEASGTGNMKLALNGALTIGTLDGANVEIREAVGAANMFIFGLTAEQVESRRRRGLGAHDQIAANPALAQAIDAVRGGVFSPDEPDRYAELMHNLIERDTFMVASDFGFYSATQDAVDRLWSDPGSWWRSSILNTAGVGWFSSDRAIAEYATDIWGIPVAPRRAGTADR